MFGFFGQNTEATPPPTFKVFCKGDEGRCLAVRDGALVLAAADPGDERQHWIKDVRYSRIIKDEEGNPVFSLVNEATGLAIQHSLGPGHPVRLAQFYPDGYDGSVLWTESADLRKAFGCIRMRHNVDLSLDAPVDGAGAVVLSYVKGADSRSDGQSWKTVPWSDEACVDELDSMPASRIYCKADEGFSVTVRDGAVCLAPTDPRDECQYWIVDKRPGDMIRDMDAYPAFALVSKVTGEAIAEADQGCNLKLKPYNPNYLDLSVLWTTSPNLGQGFRCIRRVDNPSLNFEGFRGVTDHSGLHGNTSHSFENISVRSDTFEGSKDRCVVREGTNIMLSYWNEGDNLQWKIDPWCKSP